MDRTFNYIINLLIISLGAKLCLCGFHARRTIVLGLCLIVFGGAFALAEYKRRHTAPGLVPWPLAED